jgi:hypothetical protein
MPTTVEAMERQLSDAFAEFLEQQPEIAEALSVMGVPFQDYLKALAAMNDYPSSTGSASSC